MSVYVFVPLIEAGKPVIRCPKEGEWFRGVDDVRRVWFDYQDKNEFPIYRRVEVDVGMVEAIA